MYVPEEEGDTMDNLLMDDIRVDMPVLQHGASTEGVMWEGIEEWETVGEGESSRRGNNDEGKLADGVSTIDLSGVIRQNSQYEKDALKQLELIQSDERAVRNGGKLETKEERHDDGGAAKAKKHSALLSEIDKVMARVEEAMGDLEETEGNKRVRRTLEASSKETRSLVKHIECDNSGEAVEGARVEEEWYFSLSLNRQRSREKGRGNVGRCSRQRQGVASRLRKKHGGGSIPNDEMPKKPRRWW